MDPITLSCKRGANFFTDATDDDDGGGRNKKSTLLLLLLLVVEMYKEALSICFSRIPELLVVG